MTSPRDILLARLDEHHARALEIIRRGDVLLAPDALPDLGLLSQARWELTRVLTAYQAFKQHALFGPVIRDGPPDKARIAEQMRAECIAIGDDYKAHLTRCAGLDIAAHWESYRPGVLRLLARIEAHIARERWVAASLLLEPPALRPRMAMAG